MFGSGEGKLAAAPIIRRAARRGNRRDFPQEKDAADGSGFHRRHHRGFAEVEREGRSI
jgi:hypothetical protein